MSQALYGASAPPEQLSLYGLSADDLDDTVEVFPDNWTAFLALDAMGTQWRVGMAGPTGLDYGSLPAVLSLLDIPKKTRKSIFQDLRVMEAEALLVMSESK
ncbi:MAG TPA: DUF1799 domain-containing protein [Pseudomonas sp.]